MRGSASWATRSTTVWNKILFSAHIIRCLERWLLTAGVGGATDLESLGTHPDYQRRGAGSMLVKWGCDLADKNGVAAYVDASKEGAALYKKYGFVDFSPADTHVASMARSKKST